MRCSGGVLKVGGWDQTRLAYRLRRDLAAPAQLT